MELALSLVALVVAAASLGLVLSLRSQVAQIPPPKTTPDPELERLRLELTDIRRDLDRSQRELEELKSVTQMPPAPPLPRGRSTALTDLREQLRAVHRDPEPPSDE